MSTLNCPACGAQLSPTSSECRYCGQEIAAAAQPQQHQSYQQPYQQQYQQAPPPYQQIQTPPIQFVVQTHAQPVYRNKKNKFVAALLAIFLGVIGIHKFYLGRFGQGILYLIFCWTYIPAFIAFIEGIVYLCSNEERFHEKYSR